jgi:hypothetical protein
MSVPVTKRRFTVEEYHRMAEAGILREDDRVELLDGEIIQMTPVGPRHAGCVIELTRVLSRLMGDAAVVSVQNPVVLGEHQEPQPDVALLRPRADSYRGRHPGPEDVLLVIEVAETSVEYDRERKLPLYARAGIPEAWLVDLPADAIEVHRRPVPHGYGEVRTLRRGETLTAVNFPTLAIAVGDVLG